MRIDMNLDIRIPIGLMFVVLGALLAVFGVVSDTALYEQHSLGININLWWGLALVGFGAMMWGFGRRATAVIRPSDQSAEGRKIEEIEHRSGMERESKRPGR
jgi:hypothetical protein